MVAGEEFAPLLSLSIRYHVTGSVWELDRWPSLLLPVPPHFVIYPCPAQRPFASLDDEDDDNNNIELLLLRTTTSLCGSLFLVVPPTYSVRHRYQVGVLVVLVASTDTVREIELN